MDADLSVLIAELAHPDVSRRSAAAKSLAKMGEAAAPAAVPLCRTSGDASEEVCEWSTSALEKLGPPAVEDCPALQDLAAAPQEDTAYWACTLIGRLKADAAPAVSALSNVLSEHAAINVRQRAAWALGQIGPAASAALPALKRAADDANPRLARMAQRAIDQIGGGSE